MAEIKKKIQQVITIKHKIGLFLISLSILMLEFTLIRVLSVSLCYPVSILVSFTLMNKIPFEPFSLLIDGMQFVYLPVYYLLITLPFFLAGLVIGQLFTRYKTEISRLYFFD